MDPKKILIIGSYHTKKLRLLLINTLMDTPVENILCTTYHNKTKNIIILNIYGCFNFHQKIDFCITVGEYNCGIHWLHHCDAFNVIRHIPKMKQLNIFECTDYPDEIFTILDAPHILIKLTDETAQIKINEVLDYIYEKEPVHHK
jgi:hypothetical protein